MDLQVFVGYDARERVAWNVCAASMQHHAGDYPVSISAISRQQLEADEVYTRPTEMRDGQRWDVLSDEPCSTDFSLARFWVPFVAGRVGWALFCDCDFLWRADVREIMNYADPKCAVMVVPHKHEPAPDDVVKMDKQAQTAYWRKNWSSLMLWNLGHAGAHRPNLYDLNHWHKHKLHSFWWLAPNEIGFLPECWNWLEGVSPTTPDGLVHLPKAVHFTRGLPNMPGYENSGYADEWRSYIKRDA